LLCNIGYKIITKVKGVLPSIIPENQGGFVKGWNILDNIILVKEDLHSIMLRCEKCTVVKLDLVYSFDRVHHVFLFQVMGRFGFTLEFIRWVKACISAPWICPLVNGQGADFFQASRGLRQGCPFSPLLYAIQVFVLNFQLEHYQQEKDLLGLIMDRGVK
jgi:hypothetical protein